MFCGLVLLWITPNYLEPNMENMMCMKTECYSCSSVSRKIHCLCLIWGMDFKLGIVAYSLILKCQKSDIC